MQIVTKEQLERLIAREEVPEVPFRNPTWLNLVRRLPCAFPGCQTVPAGTAHHPWSHGRGMKCHDVLALPFCIWHHDLGKVNVQGMSPERFEEAMGISIDDCIRRTHLVITDKIETGDLV